jgi:hypothetical protein
MQLARWIKMTGLKTVMVLGLVFVWGQMAAHGEEICPAEQPVISGCSTCVCATECCIQGDSGSGTETIPAALALPGGKDFSEWFHRGSFRAASILIGTVHFHLKAIRPPGPPLYQRDCSYLI